MLLLIVCAFILLYGLNEYMVGHKGRGALVFFFLLTGGFHFLSQRWCPVKYTDFAVVYLLVVAIINLAKGNHTFFKPQIKTYKVITVIGIYITLEFVRTLVLKEEILSFALANYRTYIPLFSFWLVQELREREVKRLFRQIAIVTVLSTVLFDLQPLLHIKILQHQSVGNNRYRNIPYLAYFFMLLATIRLNFSRWKTIALVLAFLIAVVLTQHRAVMMAYAICVVLYLFMTRKGGRIVQYGMIGLVFFLFAGEVIMNRFESDNGNRSTLEDIKIVLNADYRGAVYEEYENENGTLSFRVFLLTERIHYMLDHPKYAVFGLGTRHEDSPKTKQQFDFVIGTLNQRTYGIGQISSGDLAWVNPLMRFGFIGIALLLYLSWTIIRYLYKRRKDSDVAMSAFLFFLLLIIISFKNDHLYGNMQMFFVYLLIEYIRYAKSNKLSCNQIIIQPNDQAVWQSDNNAIRRMYNQPNIQSTKHIIVHSNSHTIRQSYNKLNMKISILTFSKESNFGANLQCYALCKTLQNMGHQVDIIDIQLPKITFSWYTNLLQLPQDFLFFLFRKKHLNIFTKKYKTTTKLQEVQHKSDLYIVGSDQVWNPDITKRLDPLIYFFSFLPKGVCRVSYAASFGTGSWQSPALTGEVKRLLHKFNAVSVREQTGVAICKNTFGIDARLVADPTLLLTSYDEICGDYNPQRETNELVYFTFIRNKKEQEIIADFSMANQLQAIALRSNRAIPGFKQRLYLSVAEWLNSIRYAKLVVTNSFHCMVFCVLFHKRFVAIPAHIGRTTRQEEFLEQLGLSDHFCKETDKLYKTMEHVLNKDIDYAAIDNKIKEMRGEALAFLNSCTHTIKQ